MKKYYCTHCGKYLNNISIDLSIYLEVERSVDKEWESIDNSKMINSEYICNECFEKFSSLITEFKKGK